MASTDMAPGTAELYDRIVALFATRDVTPSDRQAIRAALGSDATFDTLPEDVQRVIVANEALPQVSGWSDPADAPDEETEPGLGNEFVQTPDQRGPYVSLADATRDA